MGKDSTYVLRVGEHDDERLSISNLIYGPASRQFLKDAGIKEGGSVLDVGCGTGNMTLWLAKQVGPNGRVVGLDISKEQLAIAKKKVDEVGLNNVELIHGPVEHLNNLAEQFDLVYVRFVLIHLADPGRALSSMYQRVAVGGIFACEEPTTSSHFCHPFSPAFDKANTLTLRLGQRYGVDYDFGLYLYGRFIKLGLESIKVRFAQPAVMETGLRKIFPMSFMQIKDKLISEGFLDLEEAKDIMAELNHLSEDPEYVIGGLRNTQVYGIRR